MLVLSDELAIKKLIECGPNFVIRHYKLSNKIINRILNSEFDYCCEDRYITLDDIIFYQSKLT